MSKKMYSPFDDSQEYHDSVAGTQSKQIHDLCKHCGWFNRCDYFNPSAECFDDIETE